MKKLLCLLISFIICFGAFSAPAFALAASAPQATVTEETIEVPSSTFFTTIIRTISNIFLGIFGGNVKVTEATVTVTADGDIEVKLSPEKTKATYEVYYFSDKVTGTQRAGGHEDPPVGTDVFYAVVVTSDGFVSTAKKVQFGPTEKPRTTVTYEIKNNEAIITGVNNRPDGIYTLIVPATVEGVPVKEIGESAFSDDQNLTSIKLPNSLQRIEYRAFKECKNLNKVVWSSSLNYIGPEAFMGCENLGSLVMPDSLEVIADYAFARCCKFDHVSWVDIRFGKRLTSIGNHAFDSCQSFAQLVIPDNVESIGEGAFSACSRMQNLQIGKGITEISTAAFSGCLALENINIPDTVRTIGMNAFDSCLAAKTLIIGNGVEVIGPSAFSGCKKLKSINIPASVANIYSNPFSFCASLESITVSPDNQRYRVEQNCLLDGSTDSNAIVAACKGCSIPVHTSTIWRPTCPTEIRPYAFAGLTFTSNFVIPENITSINSNAFDSCTFVENGLELHEGLQYISQRAFYRCSFGTEESKSTLIIPSSVIEIGENAFQSTRYLYRVVISDGTKVLRKNIFSSFGKLEETHVKVPNSVNNIDDQAFGANVTVYYDGSYPGAPWGAKEVKPVSEFPA